MIPATLENPRPFSILLVDDDDGDAEAVARALRKSKIAVPIVRAVDGVDALETLRGENGKDAPKTPYLMLVDVNMPRVNGIDFVKALRADDGLRGSVVFMLTTSKREEDILAAYALNVAGYIVKAKAGEDFLNLTQLLDCYWRIVEIPALAGRP